MLSLRARVRNGRLVLDEPTDLPEGTELDLVPADDEEEPVDLSPEELADLDRRVAEAAAGNSVPATTVFAEMRARR